MLLARVLMAAPVVYVALLLILDRLDKPVIVTFDSVYICLIAYAVGRMIARGERRRRASGHPPGERPPAE